MSIKPFTFRQRIWLVPLLLTAHLLLIVFLISPTVPPPIETERPTLTVVEIDAPHAPVPPVPPPPPETAVAADVILPAFDIAEDIPGGRPATIDGRDCALGNDIQAALRAKPRVRIALDELPQSARAPGDALMLWDGHWVTSTFPDGDATLAPVRAAVVAAVLAASAVCQTAPIVGPRLLFVGDDTHFIVLAFGSGTWAWSQLVEPPIDRDSQPAVGGQNNLTRN
jgi:hypothetical protein